TKPALGSGDRRNSREKRRNSDRPPHRGEIPRDARDPGIKQAEEIVLGGCSLLETFEERFNLTWRHRRSRSNRRHHHMQISITFRQMESTDAVKTYANDKVAKLQRFLRSPLKAQVTLSCQHLSQSSEVDIHSGPHHFHAHETSEDMYASIDKVIDKL